MKPLTPEKDRNKENLTVSLPREDPLKCKMSALSSALSKGPLKDSHNQVRFGAYFCCTSRSVTLMEGSSILS